MSGTLYKQNYTIQKKQTSLQAHKRANTISPMAFSFFSPSGTLGERIKTARQHASLTQKQLADAAKVEQPLISQLETGKTLKTAYLTHIAKACRVSAQWLATGEGQMVLDRHNADGSLNLDKPWADMDAGHLNVTPTKESHRKAREYPLISSVAAGRWQESCDNFQPGDAEQWIASDANAGEHGYWLTVNGPSMQPTFMPGSRILVRPEGFDLVSGKFYVAKLMDSGETTFKQYVRDGGIGFLQPLNSAFPTLQITDNVQIIGRVVDGRMEQIF